MSLPLSIMVDRVNATRGHTFSQEGPYPCEKPNSLGELYRMLSREYGRCTSYVYVNRKGGGSQKVGWGFVRRERYDDCEETFLCETWVTVISAPHTVADLDVERSTERRAS